MTKLLLAAAAMALLASYVASQTQGREPGLYATFHTSMGQIVCKLYEKEAPKTVANFVGLARGTKQWKDPKTSAMKKTPLYTGTVFHRVIPNFMIQGGDPLGTGTGGPGYEFEDETGSGLTFNRPGLLAMANRGPNTNGSQFFITEVPTTHLNGRHTIFGEVISGQDLVPKIGRAGNAAVKLEKVTIERVGAGPGAAVKRPTAAKKTAAKKAAAKTPPAKKPPQ